MGHGGVAVGPLGIEAVPMRPFPRSSGPPGSPAPLLSQGFELIRHGQEGSGALLLGPRRRQRVRQGDRYGGSVGWDETIGGHEPTIIFDTFHVNT